MELKAHFPKITINMKLEYEAGKVTARLLVSWARNRVHRRSVDAKDDRPARLCHQMSVQM